MVLCFTVLSTISIACASLPGSSVEAEAKFVEAIFVCVFKKRSNQSTGTSLGCFGNWFCSSKKKKTFAAKSNRSPFLPLVVKLIYTVSLQPLSS